MATEATAAEAEPVLEPLPARPPDHTEHIDHSKVAKNSIIYFATQLFTWALTFAATAYIGRRLGENPIGELAIGATVIGTVFGFAVFGVEAFLVAEIGRSLGQAERLVRATFGLRLFVIPIAMAVSAGVLLVMHAKPMIWYVAGLCAFSTAVSFLSEPLRSVMAGREQGKLVSMLDASSAFVPFFGIPLLGIGVVGLLIPTCIYNAVIFGVRLGIMRPTMRLRPIVDPPTWWLLVKGGSQFVVNDLVLGWYGASTVFILQHYANEGAVGVFSQAQKLLGTFLFLPTAIGAALLPALARLADHHPDHLRTLRDRALTLMLVLSLPVAAITILLAHPFCRLLFGTEKFRGLAVVLQVYAINAIPLYIVSTLYRFLVAEKRNAIWSIFLLGTVALNGGLCFWLVPLTHRQYHNGALGAAIACVTAELVTLAAAVIFLRILPRDRRALARAAGSVAATAVMVGAVWLTRTRFILIPAAVGLVTYTSLAWIMQVFGKEEQVKLREICGSLLDPALRRLSRARGR